jgi:olfactory receptor
MRKENRSSTSKFLLLGLPIQPEQRGIFSAMFLARYLTTVLGNLLTILLIRLDSHLHTPMYFVLRHLAFTDSSLSSIAVPKMLVNLQAQQNSSPMKAAFLKCTFLFFLDVLTISFLQ